MNLLYSVLRKNALYLLRIFGKDIHITHHYVKKPFFLNSYRHKGYWFYGKNREINTMNSFVRLIQKDNNVLEIGGHIGYIAMFFSYLVGSKGSVIIFEPGENNLPYLRENLKGQKNTEIIEKGAGNENTIKFFFIENLTGQNNTFVENFEGFNSNKQQSIENNALYEQVKVEMVRVDDFYSQRNIPKPNLIKIDVEGFEFEVIKGAKQVITDTKPIVMVEIQSDYENIFNFFEEIGYEAFDDEGRILKIDTFKESSPNRFFLHPNVHKNEIKIFKK